MAKKLEHKNCVICNEKVFGVKRKDRNAYYYPKRCKKCEWEPTDPTTKEKRIGYLKKARETREKPIGTKRKQQVSPGVFYWQIKVSPTGKWPYEHRHITNAPPGSHVHHINGDTLDNRVENLVVMSPKDHISHHTGIGDKWAKLFDCCRGCGTSKKRHLSHGLCTTCYQREHKK